jgi:hypothetical protein
MILLSLLILHSSQTHIIWRSFLINFTWRSFPIQRHMTKPSKQNSSGGLTAFLAVEVEMTVPLHACRRGDTYVVVLCSRCHSRVFFGVLKDAL